MSRIKIKAVVAGVITDIAGSVVVGLLLGVLVVIIGRSNGNVSAENLGQLKDSVPIKLLGLLGTTFFTGLGGYIAGRLAVPETKANSIAVGVMSLVLGILLALSAPGITPTWKLIAGLIATLPAAMLGGRLAKSRDTHERI